MKRYVAVLALLMFAALPARAQQHQHAAAVSDTAGHGMMEMMEMHTRMMADSVIARRMMADTTMRAVTQEMMGGMQMDNGRTGAMTPGMRRQMMTRMHERMQAMSPRQRQALMKRMMTAHQRLVADPAVRARMMKDPAMHRMMGGMQHDSAGSSGHKH